jgi:hypothetical protein
VATQPELGLLPEQRAGLAFGHSGCPAFAGQNLNRVGHAPIGAKRWQLNGSNAGQVIFPAVAHIIYAKDKFMLRSIKQLYGDKLGASDSEIGQVKDFYFDDKHWAVSYVVADTGSWI